MNNERDRRISKEYRQLKKLLAKVAEDRRDLADRLLHRAAFARVALEDLEAQIAESGYTSEYQNGENQWGTKKSPEVEIYNTTVKNYSALIRQISDMVPDSGGGGGGVTDGFDDFVQLR